MNISSIIEATKSSNITMLQSLDLRGSYKVGFFEPLNSCPDAIESVLGLAALPVANLTLGLVFTLQLLKSTTFGLYHIIKGALTFDLNSLKSARDEFEHCPELLIAAVYCYANITSDTLETFVRLITRSLATVAIEARKAAGAISERFTTDSSDEASTPAI